MMKMVFKYYHGGDDSKIGAELESDANVVGEVDSKRI